MVVEVAPKRVLVNVMVLCITLTLAFLFADALVVWTGALEGISLADYLTDEFRIWLVPLPDQGRMCRLNSTALEPLCVAEYQGYHVRIPSSTMRINSIGLRDKEYPLEKAAGTYRIFVTGDSFTFGIGVDNGETFSDILEEMLNARYRGSQFDVFNLGIWGRAIDDEYYHLVRYLDYSPDMLVLQSLTNDIHECAKLKEDLNRIIESGEQTTIEAVQQNERAQLSREHLREEMARGMGKEQRCACILESFSLMLNLAVERDIPLIVYDMDTPEEYACLDDVNASNYYYVRAQMRTRREWISREDTHPNRDGHRKIAEELYNVVTSVINSTRPEVLK